MENERPTSELIAQVHKVKYKDKGLLVEVDLTNGKKTIIKTHCDGHNRDNEFVFKGSKSNTIRDIGEMLIAASEI